MFFITAEYYHNNKVDVDEQGGRVLAPQTNVVVITQPGVQTNNVVTQPVGPYATTGNTVVYQNQNFSQPGTYGQASQNMQPTQPAPSDKQLYPDAPPSYPGTN